MHGTLVLFADINSKCWIGLFTTELFADLSLRGRVLTLSVAKYWRRENVAILRINSINKLLLDMATRSSNKKRCRRPEPTYYAVVRVIVGVPRHKR